MSTPVRVTVLDDGEAPLQFTWRGRGYTVRQVLSQRGTTWDVLASTGRGFGDGRYLLVGRVGDPAWTCQQIPD